MATKDSKLRAQALRAAASPASKKKARKKAPAKKRGAAATTRRSKKRKAVNLGELEHAAKVVERARALVAASNRSSSRKR